MTAAARHLRSVPAPLQESTVPAWRSRLVGVYTDADERAEREVLGWLLTGGQVPPFTLRAEHFASRWHRLLFVACGAVQLRDGAVRPERVMACLRANGHTGPGVAVAIAELMTEACEVVNPPFFSLFAERAERRLRVLRLEREAEELRRELR